MTTDLRYPHYQEVLPTLSGKRLEVYTAMLAFGPCTPKELAQRMGWDKTSVRPRLTELKDMGKVEATGDRRDGEHEFIAIRQEVQLTLLSA
jgi:predicted transcriptional regulator